MCISKSIGPAYRWKEICVSDMQIGFTETRLEDLDSPGHDFRSSDWLTQNETLVRPQKDQGREKWRRCRVERRSENTHDTMESFRSIDLSTSRTCGTFHRKVVLFIFLYLNCVTHRSSRTISFNQQPCLRLFRTM